jgi:hypothetical protein
MSLRVTAGYCSTIGNQYDSQKLDRHGDTYAYENDADQSKAVTLNIKPLATQSSKAAL